MSTKKSFLSPSTKENLRIYRYKFSRNKLSVFGLILVCVSIFFAIFAEVIVPYPESIGSFVDYANASLPPSADHWFGTDQVGRDVFSRVIFSFRGALMVSSVDADVVVLVQDATENGTMFPPSFSSMFSKPFLKHSSLIYNNTISPQSRRFSSRALPF